MIADVVSKTEAAECPPRTRRPWTPSDDEHSIFWMVKFFGWSQATVANEYGIHQGTVSRIVERYERWQVREAQRHGRLAPEERLRAQHWLTYERNEKILSSCLRLADQTEGFVDSSKSTTQHPESYPSAERRVRTEHFAIDRTGMVSRYLRLAFKINMEQHKLVKENLEPPLPPLSLEELAAEEQAAAEAQAEIDQARQERRNVRDEADRQRRERQEQIDAELRAQAESQFRQRRVAQLVQDLERKAESVGWVEAAAAEDPRRGDAKPRGSTLADSLDKPNETAAPADHLPEGDCAHNAHIAEEPETAVTYAATCTCDENDRSAEKLRYARMNGQPAIAELRLTPAKPPEFAAVPQ